jgi:anti-sigma B factor antagonist
VETPSNPETVPQVEQLNITVTKPTEDVVVLHVSGEIDLLTASLLGERVREQLVPANRVLVLDLTDVSFLGSSGLAEIVSASQAAATAQLVLVASNRAVLRPLEATGLLPVLTVYETLDEAVASF